MVNLESTPREWDEERVIKQSFVYTEDLVKWSEGGGKNERKRI